MSGADRLVTSRQVSDLAFDHGAVSRFNAWFFTAFAGYLNHISRHHKQSAFADLQPGPIVEIEAGTGAKYGDLGIATK